MTHVVTAHSLFLRNAPVKQAGNERGALPEGTEVTLEDGSHPKYWLISGTLNGTAFKGYVSKEWLKPKAEISFPVASKVGPVHWRENNAAVTRAAPAGASPLGESGYPRFANGSADGLNAAIKWLQVETSRRYRPGAGKTYCNIYAYDVAYAAGVYLPRVWWTQKALLALQAGQAVAAKYGDTVREMNANMLHDWLQDWGPAFGWRRTFSFTDMQEAANKGRIAMICAKRKDLSRSGHIVVIPPETAGVKAVRDAAGKVVRPLNSQAGSVNFQRKAPAGAWWAGSQFSSFVLFVNDG